MHTLFHGRASCQPPLTSFLCIYFPPLPSFSSSSSLSSMAALTPISLPNGSLSNGESTRIFGSKVKIGDVEPTQLSPWSSLRSSLRVKLKASRESMALMQDGIAEMERGSDPFDKMKDRFLSFKKHVYLENLEHFQNLAEIQVPKFMVIGCADSRVCPSSILGFQPGEAFMVRNIANMVPHYERGPSETNAALEFAVNSLNVENVLVIGHSRCGGIRALMSMQDEVESSFIGRWVVVGRNARRSTKTAASNLSFDQQCRHCEKESVNCSLLNLLTYPWIEEKVRKGVLSLHGGYYDFVDCTFEKWTLHYTANDTDKSKRVVVKDRSFWC